MRLGSVCVFINCHCSVAIHAIDVVPSTNHVLKLGVTGIDIGLKMDWKYRKTHWPHLHGHGSADVSVGGTSVSVSAQLMLGSSGRNFVFCLFFRYSAVAVGAPEVKALGCNVAIGSFNLKVHGGASWLYNLLIKLFKHKIEVLQQQANGQHSLFVIRVPYSKALKWPFAAALTKS